MSRLGNTVLAVAAFTLAATALAAEAIKYRYDARGRLIEIEHDGDVNNGVVTNYAYDEADNRTGKNTIGAPE